MIIYYNYDINYIHVKLLTSRSKEQLLQAYKRAHKFFNACGLPSQFLYLDNKTSALVKQYLHNNNIIYQLAPAGDHRRNAAEWAIQTFKNHFLSALATLHPKFPLNLWDRILPQTVITLNLLCQSRTNPKLSAYAQVNGTYDFQKHPFGPLGMQVHAHLRPDNRNT